VEVDGSPVVGVDDLQRLMVAELIGSAVDVVAFRDGRSRGFALTPVELET